MSEKVHCKEDLCCEEKGPRRRCGRQSSLKDREVGRQGRETLEQSGGEGWDSSIQAGRMLGEPMLHLNCVFSRMPLLTMVRTKLGALCMLGKYFTTELDSALSFCQ